MAKILNLKPFLKRKLQDDLEMEAYLDSVYGRSEDLQVHLYIPSTRTKDMSKL